MKAKTYGKKEYIVVTYYRDTEDVLHADFDTWSTKELAKEWYDLRSRNIGKHYYGSVWDGVISSVFIYQAQLCELI
jgi:hypothetical protein